MIDPRKAALIVIDMQNGFIDPASALCVEGAAATVPACSRALDHARELGMPVFHVVREYAEDGSDVEAVRHAAWHDGGKPVSRACVNPRSLDEPAPLAPQPGDRVVVKPRFSAFFNPNDALSLDYNVAVIEDCTSSRTPAVQAANIEDMAHIGAQMLTCDEFCTQGLASVRDVAAEVAVAVRGPRA